MTELVDIYDENQDPIGTASRKEAHRHGYWHKAFHCWIVQQYDEGSVLFQLRGPDKDLYPDCLDITAAGHLVSGETSLDGLRELEEELGVVVDDKRLQFLGTRTEVAKVGDVINREFDDTYLLRDDRPLGEYVLQEDEVAGIVRVGIADGLRLFSGNTNELTCDAVRLVGGKQEAQAWKVTRESVIPRMDRYYLKIFIMAERYLEGTDIVAI